jgi:hypothetical protein
MKTKRNFLSLLLLGHLFISQITTHAQIPDTIWTIRLISGAGQNTGLNKVIQTMDGHYVATGSYFTEETRTDIWVVKFNDIGEVLWNKTYITDSSQLWMEDRAREIIETSDGELVIFASNSQYQHYLLFLNADGEQSNLIKIMDSDDPYYIYCGVEAADLGFVVAGDYSVWDGNYWITSSWYRKVDVSGNMIWEHSYPPQYGYMDRFFCISKLQEGGYILAGEAQSPDNYDELLFAKTGLQGDTIWTKKWGTAAIDSPQEIVPVSDGGYIVAGNRAYGSSYKGFLLKIDSEGTEQWYEYYDFEAKDEIFSVKPCTDGGYIATGAIKPPGEVSKPKLWVFKTDGQGKMVKSMFLGDETELYTGHSILQAANGGYIVVGNSGYEGIILKISPSFGALGIEDNINAQSEDLRIINIFPNPFCTSATISWETNSYCRVVIKIYDFMGKEVRVLAGKVQQPGEYQLDFDAGALSAGIYTCKVEGGNNHKTIKIIIVK